MSHTHAQQQQLAGVSHVPALSDKCSRTLIGRRLAHVSPVREACDRIKQVINGINYGPLYNLLRHRDSKRQINVWRKIYTPLLHSCTAEAGLLMSSGARQRGGHRVKISARLLSSKIDMHFSPRRAQRTRGQNRFFIHSCHHARGSLSRSDNARGPR